MGGVAVSAALPLPSFSTPSPFYEYQREAIELAKVGIPKVWSDHVLDSLMYGTSFIKVAYDRMEEIDRVTMTHVPVPNMWKARNFSHREVLSEVSS